MITRKVPARERFDLAALMSDTVGLLETLEQAKDIEIHFSPDANRLETIGDPALLQQVFVNLCVNGMQAMPAGGELSTRPHRL